MASKPRPHRSTNSALRIASFNVQIFGRKKAADVRVFEILVQVNNILLAYVTSLRIGTRYDMHRP